MKTYNSIIKLVAGVLAGALLISSCANFEEINSDPDATNTVNPSLIATGLITSYVKSARGFGPVVFQKQLFNPTGKPDVNQYNWLSNDNYDAIRTLTDAQKMAEFASEEMKDAYTGLYYFLKGWYFWRATMETGDMPYSQALNISEYKYPKYDAQKDIFAGILDDLAKAEECFARSAYDFQGDPFYNGNCANWRKATNVVLLKVLMSLQKRAEDTPELKVKETFKSIVEAGNLFTSNDDNLMMVFSENPSTNRNPYHVTIELQNDMYWAAGKMLVDPFKEYEDYRLFYYFAPSEALTNPACYEFAKANGDIPADQPMLTADDWNAYNGMDVAAVYSVEEKVWVKKLHCKTNEIYRFSYAGVPCIRLGYGDMNFILAEAAERGWISGSAKTYYDNGVRANLEFVKDWFKPFTYNEVEYNPSHGREITDEYIANYLKAPKTAYAIGGTQTDRLHQIWMQSYLANYFHQAYDEYFTFRRTGYPVWPVNPASNLNDGDTSKIPTRWLYPTSEYDYNNENRVAAVKAQGWGAEETINDIMWVIK